MAAPDHRAPLLAVAEAIDRACAGAGPLDSEKVPLAAALYRTLADDLLARVNQPPWNASAMDGYAVRAADLATLPAVLRVVGETAAGAASPGRIAPGEAQRIFTGAPLPSGADTVVIQEDTEPLPDGQVRIAASAALEGEAAGAYVRRAGLDFAVGQRGLAAGTVLRPRQIALAAAMNHGEVAVRRRPLVAILSTGNELVPAATGDPDSSPENGLKLGQIIASNGPGLAAWLMAEGAVPRDHGIVPDDQDALRQALEAALSASPRPDLLLTTGGASVGAYDLLARVLAEMGFVEAFHGVAMRPGKPSLFGHLQGVPVFGLPGNPVSALVCALVLVGPFLDALGGRPLRETVLPATTAPLAVPLAGGGRRQDYLRARWVSETPENGFPENASMTGKVRVLPFPVQDSAMLRPLAAADVLIVRPPAAAAMEAGSLVPILPLDLVR